MARDFEAKNIIVGAATFYVGPKSVELTKINVSASNDTAQDPAKMDATASWYHLGYTQNGVTMNIEPTYGEVVVDQLLDVARLFKSSQRVTVATSLTEGTLENLYVAIGSGVTDFKASTAATASAWLGDGGTGAPTSSTTISGTASANDVATELILNGGALGNPPVERSVCFVGPAPAKLSATKNTERIYIGYRAVSMEAVGVAVQRDNATIPSKLQNAAIRDKRCR